MTEDSSRAAHLKLIAEARAFASASPLGKPIAREMDKAILMVRRLADALEARQPTVIDREEQRSDESTD